MIKKDLRDYLTKAMIKKDGGLHNPSLFFYIVDLSLKHLACNSKHGEFFKIHFTFIVSVYPNAIFVSIYSSGREFLFKYIYSSSHFDVENIPMTLDVWKDNIKKFHLDKIFYLPEE